MKHIDVEAIRTDPQARLEFLADFCLITDEDWTALDESLVHLAPRLPELLDRLYDHLLSFDDTRRVFMGARGEVDPEYMALRKEHMTEWIMRTIAAGDRGSFAAYVIRTGQRHTGVAGEAHRSVPPRYMVGLISFIQTLVTEALCDSLPNDPKTLRRLLLGWNKILLVQLEMFLKVLVPSWPMWDEEE